MTLLLCCALLLHPATAFAVEGPAVSADQAMTVSADQGISEDSAVSEDAAVSGDGAAVLEDTLVSGDEVAVSEGDAVSADVIAVSEDAVSGEHISSYDEEVAALNAVLSEGAVYGVITDPDGCDLSVSSGEPAGAVTKLPCANTVLLLRAVLEEGQLWFEVSSFVGDCEYRGFVKRQSFVCTDGEFCEWENRSAGFESDFVGVMSTDSGKAFSSDVLESQAQDSFENFPASYRDKLAALHASHPNWVFVPQTHSVTTLDEAVEGEYADRNRNWIPKSAPDSYKEGAADSGGYWFYASKAAIKHYMNPVNFFDEGHVFMFEQLGYNSKYHTQDGVQSILNNTFMSGAIPDDAKSRTYAEAFMEIGKSRSLSPYHLASRVRLEQGVNGTSEMISGKYPGYEGYYNYFNIKASGKSAEEVLKNGLSYAKSQGWNTRYRSLNGGAGFLGNNYISVGQDTGYLEKFDLIDPLYTHQYMQNVMAPYTEAATTYSQYKSAGSLKNAFVFKIPVFTDAKDPDAIPKDSVEKFTPTVTLTQISKPNLFFVDDKYTGYAKFKVTSNFDISSISDREKTKENAAGDPYFSVMSFENGILTLKTENRNADNSRSTYKKFFGSVSGGSVAGEVNVNISTEVLKKYEKPVMKAGSTAFIEGIDTAYLVPVDAGNNTVKLPADLSVRCDDAGITCQAEASKNRIRLEKGTAFEPGKKTFLLSSALWSQDLALTANVKETAKPSVSLVKSSAVINTNVPKEYGTTNVRVIRTEGFATDIDVAVEGWNAKANEALGSTINASYSDGILSLAGMGAGADPGKYILKLTPSYRGSDGQMYPLKALKFTVKVTDKELSSALVLKKSGTINIVNRETTCVKYVPSVTNTGCGAVSEASIENADAAALFEAGYYEKGDITPDRKAVTNNAGMIVITAKEGVILNSGESYSIVLKVTMSNKLSISREVKVKPLQKPARIYCNLKKATMTRTTSVSRNIAIISKGGTPHNTVIKSVALKDDRTGGYFTFVGTGAANGSLRRFEGQLWLTDASIKNGTYTVKFLVTLVDQAQNAKPVTVTTTIRVK
ncbi:MAG: hypothetical protein J5829_05310 [Lachnospiraceae bacterium]|nr:hypothetical protein [Lachnospiraceae bacterium]